MNIFYVNFCCLQHFDWWHGTNISTHLGLKESAGFRIVTLLSETGYPYLIGKTDWGENPSYLPATELPRSASQKYWITMQISGKFFATCAREENLKKRLLNSWSQIRISRSSLSGICCRSRIRPVRIWFLNWKFSLDEDERHVSAP